MPFNRSKPMIQRWIDHYIDGPFRQVRDHWEGVARAILDAAYLNGGPGLTKETLCEFCNAFEAEYIQAADQQNPSFTRFGVANSPTIQIAKSGANFIEFNKFARSIWTEKTPSSGVVGLIYDGYKKKEIKFASIFIFSLLLYLKSPEKFNVCTDKLALGLAELSDNKSLCRAIKKGENYAEYNAAALELRQTFNLPHVTTDFVIFMGNPTFRAGMAARGFPV